MKIQNIKVYKISIPLKEGSPKRIDGKFSASDSFGLGVELDFSKLGKPEFVII